MNSGGNQTGGNGERKSTGKIVVDLVFEGMSANYDQGPGNLQPLKKIAMPDGTTHTLISRYALRYSILKTMEEYGVKAFANGEVFERSGDNQQTIQVGLNSLKEAIKSPEFQLFGFLMAKKLSGNKSIQIPRENPVKISHSISLTPFEGDVLMYTNLSFAKREAEKEKKSAIEPNPFNKEEHHSIYATTVIIDPEQIREFSFYMNKDQLPSNLQREGEKIVVPGKIYKIITGKEGGKETSCFT